MKIRIGYDLAFISSMPTPAILMLSVHPSRLEDLSAPQQIVFDPPIPSQTYTDHFGNICTRIGMPFGTLAVSSHNVVCDRMTFSYPDARSTRTAWDGHQDRIGVCRDFAHLAIALCRCMNIPARYCTGYLGDIGAPPLPDPMDFSAWFEALLEGGWYSFDARHNEPRIGRILMARGRDAADVAFSTSFGPTRLADFRVTTDELQ